MSNMPCHTSLANFTPLASLPQHRIWMPLNTKVHSKKGFKFKYNTHATILLQMSLHPFTLFCYHWHYYALPTTLTHPTTQTISCTSHIKSGSSLILELESKAFQESELELVSQFHLFWKLKKRETTTGGYREFNWNYLTSNFNSDNSKFCPIFRIKTGMFCWKKSRPRIWILLPFVCKT